MTSAAATLAPSRPRRRLVRRLLKPGNLLPAFVWLFLVLNQAVNSGFPPSFATAGLVIINSVALTLFIVRRDASRVAGKVDGVIAIAGTFSASLLHDAGQLKDAQLLPTLIQVAGLTGWGLSLLALGRSFGVVPADRGLVRHGPYRFVRHPVYACEALFFIGYATAVPTPRTFVVLAVWAALQVVRIVREERIIEGYEPYRRAVRWRVLPFVW
ncbi:MAG: isoprenylcysteine carboxylmethyltransferase family protein [Chloroflexi bacterium]|nr:MAG: isoprenylcysteine carboxylmethyltransferase family protein [Chloroflexota bacterium]